MSKNSIIPFLKDYLINFLTSPFLLDTNEIIYYICGGSLLYTNGMSMHSSKNKKYNNEELV